MNQDTHIFAHEDNGAKLIHMAQEIADYFHAYPQERAVESIASHINHFWTPKMREDFLAAADAPGQTLTPLLQAARGGIKRKKIK
ncbi:formate dehydrogenase subunit delta [Rhodoblastus sp. 17X3]|uniref:formate dehydrogenase subunit delta n=1 Tax=Rhodoblastus sp. 17X3 TaxID=3047026 RepID=UPI0024B7758B|nr:formate dehydrogenase subunit delta [Rhodoblastus sp. 17X3]MDI9849375.1 formate dehydrogenase subunit delta [Rhodoblastus sp. 17X3]